MGCWRRCGKSAARSCSVLTALPSETSLVVHVPLDEVQTPQPISHLHPTWPYLCRCTSRLVPTCTLPPSRPSPLCVLVLSCVRAWPPLVLQPGAPCAPAQPQAQFKHCSRVGFCGAPSQAHTPGCVPHMLLLALPHCSTQHSVHHLPASLPARSNCASCPSALPTLSPAGCSRGRDGGR